ncbi:MAG: preprotein translocase subunit YajC [Thermoleophilia bacterium]|nr:preprotein translocase subunit YajC [Thermoleophilia bacterium]
MGGSSWMLIIYVVAFIGIFYFMAIRPQQRQRKAHAALLSSLKKGDTIVTAAGIYGKVKRVEDNLVVVEVAKGVSMKIARRAVVEIIREGAEAKAVAPEGSGGKGKRPAEIEETVAEDYETEATEVTEATDEAEQDYTDRES